MATKTAIKTHNDLSESIRKKMVDLLNARLADAIDMYAQTKQAHWNVKGPHFIGLHELFDATAAEILDSVDNLAERAVQLGGIADGQLQSVVKRTTLTPYPVNVTAGNEHVDKLAAALAMFGKGIRAAIDTASEAGDADTADLFTEISRAVDKRIWMVEAHNQ